MTKRHSNVVLVVVDRNGVERPGYVLRAGDFITQTDYDHGRRVVTAHVDERPLPLLVRLRRWWEGLNAALNIAGREFFEPLGVLLAFLVAPFRAGRRPK